MLEFTASPEAQSNILKEKVSLGHYISALKSQLANKDFINKAPALVIAKEQAKLREAEIKLKQLS